ncbi:MAG: hypothetical protein LBC56_03415 [Oscillospiraceae bacterium]|jgi:hypothetical protein|nr:hypothetical protein [Oscillospiraceae bacterium]
MSAVPRFGISGIMIIAFLLGLALLLIGLLSKQDRNIKLVLTIIGGLILMGCIALGLFMAFVLIPAM